MNIPTLIALRSCELHCNASGRLIFDMTVNADGRIVETDYIFADEIGGHQLDEAVAFLRRMHPSIRFEPRTMYNG